MFSKRWYLIHLLGARCVSCYNENLYDLEIDHIHNDGDVERYYHTNMIKTWLQNPNRAKSRLQILCKKCHERKHHPKKEINIAVFPSKNGIPISNGTSFHNISEIIITHIDDNFHPTDTIKTIAIY